MQSALGSTARELAQRLRRRDISAVELMQETLRRIEQIEPSIRAFSELNPTAAMRAAERADQRLRRGGDLPPFTGLPIAGDDQLARVVRDGGFVVMGTTSSNAFSSAFRAGSTPRLPTRNPWRPEYYAGSSGGGAAAAVASGMLPIAWGREGAVSTRVAASFCGLISFHPSRVDSPLQLGRLRPSFGTIKSVLARDIIDAAAVMDVLQGRTRSRDRSLTYLASTRVKLPRLRVGVCLSHSTTVVDSEVTGVTRRVARLLTGMGHAVFESRPFPAIAARDLDSSFVPAPLQLARRLREALRGFHVSGRGLLADPRGTMHELVKRWFAAQEADVLITPTCAVKPPRLGDFEGLSLEELRHRVAPFTTFTAPFNMTGQPALSLPLGLTSEGLPVGVQIVARKGDDRLLWTLASRIAGELMPRTSSFLEEPSHPWFRELD